jgi:hypothetical protein
LLSDEREECFEYLLFPEYPEVDEVVVEDEEEEGDDDVDEDE